MADEKHGYDARSQNAAYTVTSWRNGMVSRACEVGIVFCAVGFT